MALYKTLLEHLTESVEKSGVSPEISVLVMNKTEEILRNQFFTIDSTIIFFIILIGFFLTKKTLKPIEENMQKQKRFIADASHEFRTPVAVVISGLEVALRNKNLSFEDARKVLVDVLAEMKEFAELSNHLLDISKYERGRVRIQDKIEISSLVLSITSKMKSLADEKGVVLKCNIRWKAMISANRTELSRVLYNILGNAIKYTPPSGAIHVSDTVVSKQYVLTIVDTGVGISREVLGKIFDPFFRGDASRYGEGAGLGLTFAKRIIEGHGGNIFIKSEERKGTSVVISLPSFQGEKMAL